MDGVSERAFGALGQFPIIQASVAILIIIGGIYMIFKATKDRNSSSPSHDQMPQWIMMGPMHDMIKRVENIDGEMRRQNELLRDIRDSAVACKAALEMIRNESRLR